MLFYGTWSEWVISVSLAYTHYVLVSILVHRYFSHKSWKAPNWFINFASVFVTVIGNASIVGWVATHRAHHAFTDTDKDPHSPKYLGYIAVQFRAMRQQPQLKYAVDILKYKIVVFLHNYHWLLITAYLVSLIVIDPFAIVYAWLVPTILGWHGGSLVNTLTHCRYIGYRNYNTPDDSMNNWLFAMLAVGDGFHNNHHQSPQLANFGHRWFEFDLGYQIIKLIRLDK